ncbi:MAG: dienelactone hydrolase family protein [Parvularculaceae bacterium]
MRRGLILLAASLSVLGLICVALFQLGPGQRLVLEHFARGTPKTTIDAHRALIGPAIDVAPPPDVPQPAAGHPAVILFHGCAKQDRALMAQWIAVAHEESYLAATVDSFSPRGIDHRTAEREVCVGGRLIAQERAGDVLAAAQILAQDDRIDPKRIVLQGWSHGAWSIMDLMTMDLERRRPSSIGPGEIDPPDIAGLVLFYPYCGVGAWSRLDDWAIRPKTLAFVSGADRLVPKKACPPIFERLAKRGADVDFVVYENARHQFDDATLPPDEIEKYDAETHADAIARYRSFLREIRDRG